MPKGKKVVRRASQKKTEKTPRKPKRRTRCLKIAEPERLYEIINYVQTKRKEVNVHIRQEDMMPIAENIMRDVGITFKKKKEKGRYIYKLFPGPEEISPEVMLERIDDEDFDLSFFDEEIP